MVETPRPLTPEEEIAASLRDRQFQDTAAVAESRGNDLANTELMTDLRQMSQGQLRSKYGEEVALQRNRLLDGQQRLFESDTSNRTFGETVSDSASAASSALYRDVGTLGILAWAYGGNLGNREAAAREAAEMLSAHGAIVAGIQEANLSQELQGRQHFSNIEGQLDRQDSERQRDAEIASGKNELWANLRHEGRTAIDAGERLLTDPALAGNLVSEGVGSLIGSAPLAGAGGLVAKGATYTVTRNALAQRVAQATGTSIGAGASEVGGVYSETVQDVMSVPVEALMEASPVMQALVSEGMTPEEARIQLAGITAETAAVRQMPATLALGFITSRFEAMPMGVFADSGVARGLLQIAGEGIEEAGQGLTGTINRNISIEEYAQIGRNALEGAGEEAVIGALAGMGTAGVAATPAAVIGGTRTTAQAAVDAANALFSDTQYNDSLRQDVMGGSRASRAAATVREAVQPVVDVTAPVVSATTQKAQQVAGRVSTELQDYVARPSNEEVTNSIQATVNATESLRDIASRGQLRDQVQTVFDSPDVETPSEGFADVAGGSRNLFDNVTGIVAKMGSKGFKPTDGDTAYAAAQLTKLQGMVNSLPKQAKQEFGKVLSSKMVENVISKATKLDLNKEGASNDVETVRSIAKVNPTAVNPDATDQILEESGENISPEDTKLMKTASKLARIVNQHVEARVQISRNETVNLTASGRKASGKEKTVADVSRQIYADGFVTEGGKKLRSINDFAREIFTGVQSPDGTVINQEGRVQTVSDVMTDFQKFAQHMVNKVTALNESIADSYVTENGKRGGKLKNFTSPVRGVRNEGVRYSPDNPNSVAFAQQVAAEQNAVVDAFNTLRTEFPDLFGSFSEMQKVELTPATEQPTAVEEVSPENDEQNQTQEETQTPTVSEESSTPQGGEVTSTDLDPEIQERVKERVVEMQQNKLYEDLTPEQLISQIEFARNLLSKTRDRYAANPSQKNERLLITHTSDLQVLEALRDRVEPEAETNDEEYLINDNGQVMTFYHGTGGPEFNQFTDSKDGIFLTTRKGQGREYAIGKENPRLVAVNVRVTNPLVVDADPDAEPQDMWLSQRTRIEREYEAGGHDAIIIQKGDEAIVIVYNGSQIDIINQNVDRPTVSEPEALSEQETDEAQAESVTSEENDSGEQFRQMMRAVRNQVKKAMPRFNKYVKKIEITNNGFLGHAWYGDAKIDLDESLFDENNELTALGRAVTIHEAGHIADEFSNPDGVPWSTARTFYEGGAIYTEMQAVRGQLSGYFNKRLEYAFGKKDTTVIASELFAVATEMAYSTEEISGDLGATAAFMEHVYGDQLGTEAVGTSADLQREENEQAGLEDTEESGIGERNSSGLRQVTEAFWTAFTPKTKEAPVKSLQDFMEKYASKPEMNKEYVTIMQELLPEFVRRMNARLQRKTKDGGTVKTYAQHIKDGRVAFRKFKAGALMNPATEQYDSEMLELAMLAAMDFISTATASDPRKLDDTLERMGLNMMDLTDEGVRQILFGLPPSQVSDTLASDLRRLWNVDENTNIAVDNLEGVSHGFAKEILTVLADMDVIDINTVKVSNDEKKKDAVTIMVNTPKITEYQDRIAKSKGEGVLNTTREAIFNDARTMYEIGQKIPTVMNSKGRGTGILSDLERAAVRRMQDIPHRLIKARAKLLEAIGEENLATILGYKDPNSVTHPVLKRSVIGKNASVRRDLLEVTALVIGMEERQASDVYFPVGVTKVGRHQMQGPNPQNNKLMRFVVAPQKSTLSLTDPEDTQLFWLGVVQQADLFKAEKKDHTTHLPTAIEAFNTKYGEAVEMVKTLLEGGEFDSDVFTDLVGEVEPAVFAAIEAVASRELAMEAGETTFDTALSFELDGLTNGAANMMVNFGHGLMTPEDWNSFKSIGYFLGTTAMTVTKHFTQGAKDLYEMVAQTGDRMLTGDTKFLKPWQVEQRMAAGRLATAFGNFEMTDNGQFKMTRNTAKNPMTKVNYGSGVQGVAVGVADDMLLDFYEKLQTIPENADWNVYFYAGIMKDMETVGLKLPNSFGRNFVFSNDAVEQFRKTIQFTVGKTLTNATRQVLGHRIEQLNDMLVLSTNLQSKYLQKLFDQEINKLAEDLAKQGVIKRNKDGVPNKGEIPRKYYNELEERLGQMGAIFVSDEQTLAVGGMEKKLTDLRLSSNLDEQLVTPARMRRPDEVGVRALPFLVIGSGDAMMMNLIFGEQDTPNDVLPVFDGIDVPVKQIKNYAKSINNAVLRSWERDVLGMAVQNFDGFLSNDLDQDLLNEAWSDLMTNNKKESLKFFQEPQDLQGELQRRLKENRARKKVFKKMAVSVDQMGGSDVGFQREGETWDLTEVNVRIQKELDGDTKPKDVKTPVETTTAKALLDNMRNLTTEQKKAMEILKPLMGDVTVVFGTIDQLNDYRRKNFPVDGAVLKAPSNYDFKNNVMFMSTDTNESVLHEMVHAATYAKVLEHYEGVPNAAVQRLEVLMGEFMSLESKSKSMNEAQAAIARRLARNDAINQAAAVNEFMAYVLTNSRVRSATKKVSVLADFGSKVMNLLRRMLGGMPASMYDHVVFNTRVLNEQSMDDVGGSDNNPPDDPVDETTPPFENHTNYWIDNFKSYMRSFTQDTEAKQKSGRDILNSRRVVEALRQGGLLAQSKDRATFKAIYGIMLSDMKLDPNARIALTRVFEHVVENMTPDMFGSTPEDRQTYSAVLNALGAIQNGDTSDAAAVFFALSQTSKKFRAVLDQIPAPEGNAAVQGTLNDFVTRISSFTMHKLMGSLKTNNVPNDVLDAVAQVIIDHDKDKEFRILKQVTSSITAADNYVSGKLSSTSEWMSGKNQDIQANARGRLLPFLSNAVTMGTNLLDKERTNLTAQSAKNVTHMGIPVLSIVPIREFVSEVVGTDKQNSIVVDMLNKVNAAVSGMRQAYREDLPGILEREFQTPPTKEQWKAMFNTLAKTDFSTLVNLDNMRQTMRFLEESQVRRTEIQKLEQELAQKLTASNMADTLDKAKQLADFMNGEKVGKLLVRNAYAIVKNLQGTFDPTLVDTVDRLISVYAVDRMNAQTREEVVQLWQEDPNGVTSIVAYLQGLNEAEEAKPGITEQARLNGYKGYIPNEGRDNAHIIVDLDSNKDARARMGYVKLDISYEGETDSIYPRSYYVSNVRRQGAYSQGVMQNVAMTYRGVDTNTGLTVGNSVAGFISGDSSIDRIMRNQLDPNTILPNEQEALMPVFAGDGTVMGFERSISQSMQETHFGREENLAIMLGAWAGRQVEESLADQYNKQLVDELAQIWNNREQGSDRLFEDMKRSEDPIYKESWKLIPTSTKSYIESKFEGRFMVPRSMVNLSVGYREPSITDMWSGKTRMPKAIQAGVVAVTERFMGRNAMRWLATSEEALQGTVSTAKDIIVVRSLVVPVANIQANMLQLLNAGVPSKQVFKSYRLKLAEAEEFVKNRTKIIDLEQKLKIARNPNQKQIIEDKIQVLEDLNKQMSIAPMIAAGQFKNLSEGITDLDVDISSGRIGDYVEKLANKLPDRAADIAKVGLVSKSTKLYQVLNRATQYGDFIAKSIYYDHLISEGLSSEKASEMVNEEFVNFSVLPGRVRSGLESNGLTWFMAFKIRIMKIAAKQLRDNPVRSLAINSMIDVGGPVSDNLLAVIAEGRLDYATGYEMLFDAPELNPWINLLSE